MILPSFTFSSTIFMPGEFVFVPTHYSPELQSELAKALRARTEIISRKKNPKLWRMTDGVNRFAEECRADDPLLKRRGIVRIVLSVILAAAGVFLLVTGLMEPKNMTLLVTGVIALVIAAARFLPRPDADMTRQFQKSAALSEIRVAAAKEPRRDGSVVKTEDSIHGRGNADQDKPEIGRLPV